MIGIFTSIISVQAQQDYDITPWIKNNAGWWADGVIDDSSFIQGIQFLIKSGILIISQEP